MDATVDRRFSVVKEYFTTAKIDIPEIELFPHERIVNVQLFIRSHLELLEKSFSKSWALAYLERLERLRSILMVAQNKKSVSRPSIQKETNNNPALLPPTQKQPSHGNDQTLFT